MRLLIVTQAVDQTHPVLGFFHSWIERFARECEQVEVICLYEGTHALPDNVRVHSLGKEEGRQHPVQYAWRFIRLVWKLRGSYDQVFVHMNPEYVVLAGWLWRLLGKRVGLWYLHKSVTRRLRIAIFFASVVFTASAASMRVETPKKMIVGHGLLIEDIPFLPSPTATSPIRLLTVGRLSPVKRVEILINALPYIPDAVLTIVGGSVEGDGYEAGLRQLVSDQGLEGRVHFAGAQPPTALAQWFEEAHLFVHASDTGSLDKVLLEALARGIPVVTTNHELAKAVGEPLAYFSPPVAAAFAGQTMVALEAGPWKNLELRLQARRYVEEHHDLNRLVTTLVAALG